MIEPLNLKEPAGAIISPDKVYRYALWRIWNHNRPLVMFIMLNPSKADGFAPDPTMTRCMSFAQKWGYGGILIGNLFAFRSTNPDNMLLQYNNIEGPLNQLYLQLMAQRASTIIYAHGAHPATKQAPKQAGMFDRYHDKFYCLGTTKGGQPKHPLYLKGDTQPIIYVP